MNDQYNARLTENARSLRKSMTREERRLWYDFFKRLPETVRRQKVFGNYIVDFYIESARIVIEVDGSQHYEKTGQIADAQRDAYLKALGMTVLRYSNADVNYRFDSVCDEILHRLNGTDGETADSP